MHTKWFKFLICFQRFGKIEKIWKLNDFENSIFASRYQIAFGLCGPLYAQQTLSVTRLDDSANKLNFVIFGEIYKLYLPYSRSPISVNVSLLCVLLSTLDSPFVNIISIVCNNKVNALIFSLFVSCVINRCE